MKRFLVILAFFGVTFCQAAFLGLCEGDQAVMNRTKNIIKQLPRSFPNYLKVMQDTTLECFDKFEITSVMDAMAPALYRSLRAALFKLVPNYKNPMNNFKEYGCYESDYVVKNGTKIMEKLGEAWDKYEKLITELKKLDEQYPKMNLALRNIYDIAKLVM